MADETSVGTVSVEVLANTQKLEKGMKQAGTTVAAFSFNSSGTLNKFSDALTRVEIGGSKSKKAIMTLAHAFGEQGNAAGGLVNTMLAMGPAVGLAVGAFMLYNRVHATTAENTKNNIQNANDYAKALQKVGEITGTVKAPGIFTQDIAGTIGGINDKLGQMSEQFEEVSGDWLAGGTQLKVLNKQMQLFRDRQAELLVIQRQLEPLNVAKDQFDTNEFNNKMVFAAGTQERMNEDLKAASIYAGELADIISKLPVGGTAYNQVLKEQRTNSLNILEISNKIKEVNQKAAEEMAKEFEDARKKAKDIEKGFIDSGKNMEKALRTPGEVMADRIAYALGLLDNGFISLETFNREQQDAQKQFESAQKKPETTRLGFGTQLDTSRVSADALRMAETKVQKVSDPALKETNAKLDKLVSLGSAKQVAVTS